MTSVRVGWSTIIVMILLTSASACGSCRAATLLPEAVAAVLWLPDDAVILPDATQPRLIERGRSVFPSGGGAVVFRMTGTCESFADMTVRRFTETGWSQRQTQYLNPDQPTSFRVGCQRRGGGVIPSGSRGMAVTQPYVGWVGEWQNAEGDIVSYTFGGNGAELDGYASYAPRHVVRLSPHMTNR